MPREQLRIALQDLERELESLDEMDEETRALLQNAALEIRETLQAEQPETPHGVMDRMQEAAVSFEASHPTVAGILNRIVNALGQIGI